MVRSSLRDGPRDPSCLNNYNGDPKAQALLREAGKLATW